MHLITNEDKCIVAVKHTRVCIHNGFHIHLRSERESLCLTHGAAQTLPLLPPLGITQNVNNERGELPSVETGQLLTALRAETGVHDSLGVDYRDITHNSIQVYLYSSAYLWKILVPCPLFILKNTACKI